MSLKETIDEALVWWACTSKAERGWANPFTHTVRTLDTLSVKILKQARSELMLRVSDINVAISMKKNKDD